LKTIEGVKCYSSPNESGIVSFALYNMPSNEVADILNTEYDVAVRGGFHCSPLLHKHLNTEVDGLVRVSLAVQNSTREINYFLRAIKEISKR
jgi:selenocysteine lyase/cysteine desulfurase